MTSIQRIVLIATGLSFYLIFCLFLFPMIHDFFHETGHAITALCSGYTSSTTISLGAYVDCVPPNIGPSGAPPPKMYYCLNRGWFFNSLNRRSVTNWMFNVPRRDVPISTQQLISAMGGFLGLVGCHLLVGVLVFLVWMFYMNSSLFQALSASLTFTMIPLKWIHELAPSLHTGLECRHQVSPKATASHSTSTFDIILMFLHNQNILRHILGLGAIILQLDLVNEIYYSFFPSRLITFEYMSDGDGSKLWRLGGVDETSLLRVSYGTWVLLVITYAYLLVSYYRFAKQPVLDALDLEEGDSPFRGSKAKSVHV